MKKYAITLFLIFLCECSMVFSQTEYPGLNREAHLGDVSHLYCRHSGFIEGCLTFRLNCFVNRDLAAIQECQLWSSGYWESVAQIVGVQIQSSEDSAWNSLASYDSLFSSHENILLSSYYKGDSLVESDSVLPTGKFIQQKELGLFEFRIRDGFGSYDDLVLDFRPFLSQISFEKNALGEVKISFPPEKISSLIFGQDSVAGLAQNVWSDSSFTIPEKFDGEIATLRLDGAKDSYTSLNNSDWDFFFDRDEISLYLTDSKYFGFNSD